MRATLGWLVGGWGLVGCVEAGPPLDDGGQIGAEEARCDVVNTTALARDEVSPLGFAADDVLAYAEGTHAAAFTWADGAGTDLTVDLVVDGAIAFLEREYVAPSGDGSFASEIALDCPDVVSIGATVGFATADGAFAESWALELLADTADALALSRTLDAIAGTYDAWDYARPDNDYDEVTSWLDASFDASGVSGVVSGQGSGVVGDPNDPDSAAYAEAFDVGAFVPAE